MTDSASKPRYIFDCSPAIMLLEKCQLFAQLKAFSEIYTVLAPSRVMEEYSIGDAETHIAPDINPFKQVFNPIDVKVDEDLLPYFFNDSTDGEFWVISYARQHPEFICVIDETFGRNICENLGLKVTGTIGIIKEMKSQGLLTSDNLKFIRNSIKGSRFYLSRKLLQEIDEICGCP